MRSMVEGGNARPCSCLAEKTQSPANRPEAIRTARHVTQRAKWRTIRVDLPGPSHRAAPPLTLLRDLADAARVVRVIHGARDWRRAFGQ